MRFALQAMEEGLAVHASDKRFTSAGRSFARGSIVVRRHENDGTAGEIDAAVRRAAAGAGVEVVRSGSGRSVDDGPDLGGGHFRLLARPRIAIVSNMPVAPDAFGHLWHHLDTQLGAPLAMLDAQQLGSYDLRRYNVLILPTTWSGLDAVLEPMKGRLESWLRGGGTLVACGDAAASLTRERLGLSQVVLRRHALEELEAFTRQAEREDAARVVTIDEALVWGDAVQADEEPSAEDEDKDKDKQSDAKEDSSEASLDAEQDRWLRRFSPYGVTLRGQVDQRAWITAGAGDELPVYANGSRVFLSDDGVRTAVRLAEADRVRLGGLVWPEARERLGRSAWLTVERIGRGQVVLFAALPGFRGYHRATGRLFSNAVVLGPGLGADQPVGW